LNYESSCNEKKGKLAFKKFLESDQEKIIAKKVKKKAQRHLD